MATQVYPREGSIPVLGMGKVPNSNNGVSAVSTHDVSISNSLVAAGPVAPVLPVTPNTPPGPVGPVRPVALGPAAPEEPVGPEGPDGPVGPRGPFGAGQHLASFTEPNPRIFSSMAYASVEKHISPMPKVASKHVVISFITTFESILLKIRYPVATFADHYNFFSLDRLATDGITARIHAERYRPGDLSINP